MTGPTDGGADAPFAGGCACGAIRYSVIGTPVAGVECHCTDCRKDSGTGHASHLAFMGATVTLTGTPATHHMMADSGATKTRGFCPACGTPVTLTFAARPEFFSVRAGTLDDPDRYVPTIVTYASRRPAWDVGHPGLPTFAEMPPR